MWSKKPEITDLMFTLLLGVSSQTAISTPSGNNPTASSRQLLWLCCANVSDERNTGIPLPVIFEIFQDETYCVLAVMLAVVGVAEVLVTAVVMTTLVLAAVCKRLIQTVVLTFDTVIFMASVSAALMSLLDYTAIVNVISHELWLSWKYWVQISVSDSSWIGHYSGCVFLVPWKVDATYIPGGVSCSSFRIIQSLYSLRSLYTPLICTHLFFAAYAFLGLFGLGG